MSRIDHLAFRVKDRHKTAKFFIDAFGYKIQQEFTIDFGDGETAQCIALEPPEKQKGMMPWTAMVPVDGATQEYHMPCEIFVSDGSPGSIVAKWVEANGNKIHHIAIQVDSVEKTMKEWKERGYAEFTSEEPMKCPGLVQIFSKPSELTGVIYEFIERGEHGFCKDNVKHLMESTKNF